MMRRRANADSKESACTKQSFAFTMIEVALTLLITAVLTGISFSFLPGKQPVWVVRQKVFELRHSLTRVREVALRGGLVDTRRLCASGLLFQMATKQYEGVAQTINTNDCSTVPLERFDLTGLTAPTHWVNKNLQVVSTNNSDVLKGDWSSVIMAINHDGVPLNCQRFGALFIAPYGQPVVFCDGTRLSWQKIVFSVKLQDVSLDTILTPTGHLLTP